MWATNFIRNPGTLQASFPLVDCLIKNREYDHAKLIAETVYEMATHPATHDIPDNMQQPILAIAAGYLADALYRLDQSGGVPPEEKKKIGEEAISLARKSVEIATRLFGAESEQVLCNVHTLARTLDHFNNFDDDESIRLFTQSKVIYSRTEGSSSYNVASADENLGRVYVNRGKRALDAKDVNRASANWELALPHFREAARVFRVKQLGSFGWSIVRN